MTLQELLNWLPEHRDGKTVVLVTGVFDLFHEEHRKFLEKAKGVGNILVVGVESDLRVRQLKGENRPIWNQDKRVSTIEEAGIANAAFVLPEQFSKPVDHERLIESIRPDFLAVSSHTQHQAEKQRIMEQFGGQLVIVHELNPAVSTSQKITQKNTTN
jgi:cytidyltransferase-like protein